jgi:hypothetical protein
MGQRRILSSDNGTVFRIMRILRSVKRTVQDNKDTQVR